MVGWRLSGRWRWNIDGKESTTESAFAGTREVEMSVWATLEKAPLGTGAWSIQIEDHVVVSIEDWQPHGRCHKHVLTTREHESGWQPASHFQSQDGPVPVHRSGRRRSQCARSFARGWQYRAARNASVGY